MELCPRCGAYWRCDCRFEDPPPPATPACPHDWVDAVAVEINFDAPDLRAKVMVCRLCGLYSVTAAS